MLQLDRLGPFQLGRRLGRGGMGTVYEAVDSTTGQSVAIKVIMPVMADDPSFRERFEKEVETLRKLRHPNIVELRGFGEQNGHLYYVMELITGPNLDAELRQSQQYPWTKVLPWAIDLCNALRHAHDRGVVHRDIKPANLLLTTDGQVKLSDFGIAKLFGATGFTEEGGVVGTAEYMAPEQADGRPVTQRSDLYSLGLVIYALLAGKPPFRGASIVEVINLQQFGTPLPIRQLVPNMPPELEQLLGQLLSKNPEDRPANARILSRRLEQILTSQASDSGSNLGKSASRPNGSPQPAIMPSINEAATLGVTPLVEHQLLEEVTDPHAVPSAVVPEGPLVSMAQLAVRAATIERNRTAARISKADHFTPVEQQERERELLHAEPGHPLLSPQTLVLIAAILTLGLGAWYFFQPRSADRLASLVEKTAARGSAEDKLRVSDEIDEFLARFPRDQRAKQFYVWQREIARERLDRRLRLRASNVLDETSLSPIERAYVEAVVLARTDPESGRRKFQSLIELYQDDFVATGDAALCLELAQAQIAVLDEKIAILAETQLPLLQNRLESAQGLLESDLAAAHHIWQGLVELYQNKPWAKSVVEQAQSQIQAHPLPAPE